MTHFLSKWQIFYYIQIIWTMKNKSTMKSKQRGKEQQFSFYLMRVSLSVVDNNTNCANCV